MPLGGEELEVSIPAGAAGIDTSVLPDPKCMPTGFPLKLLQERIVPLLVEPRTAEIDPYPYSGFFVSIAGTWLWLTAAHCANSICAAIEAYPNATTTFVSFAETTTGLSRIEIPRKACNFLNFQEMTRSAATELGEKDFDRAVDNFDIAAMFVPEAIQCYLMQRGVKPFVESEIFSDTNTLVERLKGNDNSIFTGGVPECSLNADHQQAYLNLSFFHFRCTHIQTEHPDLKLSLKGNSPGFRLAGARNPLAIRYVASVVARLFT